MVKITKIRVEHHVSPAVGIGEREPRISWSFAGDDSNWEQTSYEISVRRAGKDDEVSRVRSASSQFAPWPSQPLNSRERVEVSVRAEDGLGKWSEWSDIAVVEAGLLNKDEWQSCLIEPAGNYPSTLPHRPILLRREFGLDKSFSSARLYVTAHGLYTARINGREAGDHVLAPGWTSYKHRLIYQTYDIGNLLRQGSNKIDVDVAEGWFCGRMGFLGGRSNNYGDRIGLIAMICVCHVDGSETVIGTDDSWRWTASPIISSEIYDGEVCDARVESAEHSWDVVKSFPITDNLVAPLGPPVRRKMEIRPVKIITSPLGKTIVDMGQNMVGWVRVEIHGASGTTISFQHAEVLENGEVSVRPLRDAKCRDTLILADDPIIWEPKFTFHGFRYVEVSGWPGQLQLDDITGIVVHSDMERVGQFTCSNPLLNRLHENVVWSVRGNFVSLPTDCPQRDERLGWTGDINVFSDTANLLFDTSGMLLSWLDDLVAEQAAANGIVPLVVPNIIDGYTDDAHAIWGDVAVMLPWSLYRASGDISTLTRQYSSMKAWIQAIPRASDGLWNYTASWKLGDWLDPAAPPEDAGNAKTDPTLVSDAFLVHITKIMSDVSGLLGKKEDEIEYTKATKKLQAAFAYKYITAAGLMVGDTQTALALAIHFSLFPTTTQEQTASSRLSQLVLEKNRFCIATGFAGTPYIGHALSKIGQSNLFYRMLLHRKNPSWLYPVIMGATTIWERWDSMLPDGSVNPGEMTSFNHYALGSVASWMYNTILGLSPITPGWQTFKVAPIPGGGLKWAQGSYQSRHGKISVRWEIKPNHIFWIRLRVPPGSKAEVKLPGAEEVKCVSSGKHEWEVSYQPDQWPPRAIYPPTMVPDDALPEDEILELVDEPIL